MNAKFFAAIGAVALSAAVAHADVQSANIVGYKYVQSPYGWSIFTPVFENISATSFDLTEIIPCTTNDLTTLNKDNSVYVCLLDDKGNYGKPYYWYGASHGGWVTKVVDEQGRETGEVKDVLPGAVGIPTGKGFAINNTYYTGTLSKKYHAINLKVSGQVDLICRNLTPYGWSIGGNSTPVPVDLADIQILATNTLDKLNKDNSVYLCKLDDKGNYGTPYYWYGSTHNGWITKVVDEQGRETGEIRDVVKGEVPFESGRGFAINNTYYTGTLSKKYHAVIVQLPSPIK